MIPTSLLAALLSATANAPSPAIESGYHTPPAPIARILAAPPTPMVRVSPDHQAMALLGRENLPTIANVSKPILRLGGYRIDPATNGPAEVRVQWLDSLSFQEVASGKVTPVRLPAGARFFTPDWSPDGKRLALIVQQPEGLTLWVAERDGSARPLVTGLNAAFGTPYEWTPDSRALIVRRVKADRGVPPVAASTPTGPIVEESIGRVTAARTYQDLLQNATDEALFDHYFTGQLERVPLDGSAPRAIGAPGLITRFSVSPDGRYLLTETLKRPYSYLLPAPLFPTVIAVSTLDGQPVKTIADRPLADDLPVDFDAAVKGPREVEWRSDAPATLLWAEAQDGGDPKANVPFHDRLWMQAAPFDAAPVKLADLQNRFARVLWGRGDHALVIDRKWKTRTERRSAVDPSKPGTARLITERNYQDQLTQGYAVLDGPAMPIVGPNGTEPNDTYIEQLKADAEAAVDAVVKLGVADRHRRRWAVTAMAPSWRPTCSPIPICSARASRARARTTGRSPRSASSPSSAPTGRRRTSTRR